MAKLSYNVSIGAWAIKSADDPRTELIGLMTRHSLGPADDCAYISIYAPPAPKQSLLEQAASAAVEATGGALGLGGSTKDKNFSIQVRGKAIKHADQIHIEVTAGNLSGKVMTADVLNIESSLNETRMFGTTGKRKMACTRLNQVYENQSLSQIVKDLAGQAGVELGSVDQGSTYSYFVVHESKTVLAHVQELANREGMDVYFDPENKLTVQRFSKSSPDHTFYFGIDLLDVQVARYDPPSNHVFVYGESPASKQGSSTWPWLAKDLKPFRAELGSGNKRLALGDRALRTKEAADSQAKAKLGSIKDRATSGRLIILGNPMVKLGQAIEIKDAPPPELNGLFKVTSVRHQYSKQAGLLTTLSFTGQGGAKEAEGLLGQALGALTGALGL